MTVVALDASEVQDYLDRRFIKIANLAGLRGPLLLESHCQIGGYVQFPPVAMGSFSFSQAGRINNTSIGRFCSVAPDVCIGAPSHPIEWVSTSPIQWQMSHLGARELGDYPAFAPRKFKGNHPVTIGNDVWIGQGAVIRGGIDIGHGSIVGANAVVTRDVPPYAIVGGVPARLIRYRFDSHFIAALLDLCWWDYSPRSWLDLRCDDPLAFVKDLSGRVKQGEATKLDGGKVSLNRKDRTDTPFEVEEHQ